MTDFAAWLRSAADSPETAFEAHRRLAGRTARLLMNLILIRAGYPPIAVRPEDRLEYIRALQEDQSGQGPGGFDDLLHRSLDATPEEYVRTIVS